jgi:hypothetical protein
MNIWIPHKGITLIEDIQLNEAVTTTLRGSVSNCTGTVFA